MAEEADASSDDGRGRLPLRHDLRPASINPLRAPSTVLARLPPPRLDFGQAVRAASSGSVLGDRLRPLTPLHQAKSPSRTMVTTSPASSDLGSPRLPEIRSFSNTSLSRLQANTQYSPRPPTPTFKKGRGGRPSSIPRVSPHSRKSSSSRPGTPHPQGKPSVKHLTCFWWKEKGDCRFKEEDCLYAHHDTGLYADPPRQVIPGEPAMAGRSLDRALKKLHSSHNKSSTSLKSMSSDIVHADNGSSRPVTPGTEPPPSPAIFEQLKSIESAYAAAKSDNAFLRNLVEQNTKEKAVFITTVENLQAENKIIRKENSDMKADRDTLHAAVSQMQKNQRQLPTNNPYGAIGSSAGLDQNTQLSAMLRNLGGSF